MQATTDPVTEIFGHVTVITWSDAEGISINVFAGGTRNSTLSALYPHTDREGAKLWYRTIRDAAKAREMQWQIEGRVKELSFRPVDDAEQALIDDLNADFDQRDKQAEASRQREFDAAQAIVGDGQGWTRFSTQQRAAVTSVAMDRVLASADGRGYIVRGKNATSRQLIALASRNLVELDKQWQGRTQHIAGAWLYGRKPTIKSSEEKAA